MKSLIFKISVFLVLLLAVFRIPGCWDNLYSNDANVLRLELAKDFPNVDVLILGNSHSYSGINPLVLEEGDISALNFATAAAGPYVLELVYNDYVERSGTKPKAVLINIGPSMICNGSDVFNLYPIHRYLQTPVSNERLWWNGGLSFKGYYQSTVKSFKQGIRKLFVAAPETGPIRENLRKYKGYMPRNGVYSDSIMEKNRPLYEKLKKEVTETKKKERLQSWIIALQQDGVKVILHEIPCHRFYEFIPEQVMKDYLSFVEEMKKNKDLIFIPKAVDFVSGDFADVDHLSTGGAKKYSAYLLPHLKTILHGKTSL